MFVQVLGDLADTRLSGLVERARVYAGHLFALMRPTGQKFRFQEFPEPDGSLIVVHCHAGPVEMVQVRIGLAGRNEGTVRLTLNVEHGWLTWLCIDTFSGECEEVLPLTIYTDAVLASYWGSDDAVAGLLTLSKTQTCEPEEGVSIAAPEWADPPILDQLGAYLSAVWAPPRYHGPTAGWVRPDRYSGRLRGLVQTLWALGRAPTELGIGEPSQYGLILYEPTWTYWLASIDSGGCVATKLQWDSRLACLARWLRDEQLGPALGPVARLAESYVMATLKPAVGAQGQPIQVESLSGDQCSPVYDDGYDAIVSGSWQTGWCWSQDGTKAIFVAHKTEEHPDDSQRLRVLSRVWRVAVTPSAEAPTATISGAAPVTWCGAGVMIPSPSGGYEAWFTGPSIIQSAGAGPVTGWYSADGTERIVEAGDYPQYVDEDRPYATEFLCGEGYAENIYGNASWADACGAGVPGLAYIEAPARHVGISNLKAVEVWQIGTASHTRRAIASNPTAADARFNACGGWDATVTLNDVRLWDVTEDLAGVKWIFGQKTRTASRHAITVGLMHDPESAAVIGWDGDSYAQDVLQLNGSADWSAQGVFGGGFVWRATGSKEGPGGPPGYCHQAQFNTVIRGAEQDQSVVARSDYLDLRGAFLVGRDAVLESWDEAEDDVGPWSTWRFWDSADLGAVFGPAVRQSWGGRATGTTEVDDEGQIVSLLPEGMDETALDHSGAWIGGV